MVSTQELKRLFFTYRNGVVADQLRKALEPNPYNLINGLMVPQIAEIARDLEPSMELADALWDDNKVRECRLLACYLFPPEKVDLKKAEALIKSVQTPEEADMLAFRLLKRLPFANDLVDKYAHADSDIMKYASTILSRHIGITNRL